MTEETDRYTYRVMWSEEDVEYVGLCAEFGLLSHLADTRRRHFRVSATWWNSAWMTSARKAPQSLSRFPLGATVDICQSAYRRRRIELWPWTQPRLESV